MNLQERTYELTPTGKELNRYWREYQAVGTQVTLHLCFEQPNCVYAVQLQVLSATADGFRGLVQDQEGSWGETGFIAADHWGLKNYR